MGRPASGKWRAEPRSEPDSGHPTVRDRRGALGDVTHGEPRNPTRKSKERLWSLLAYRCARPGSIPTTRTSGSVGGQGQQRPWSTRPWNSGPTSSPRSCSACTTPPHSQWARGHRPSIRPPPASASSATSRQTSLSVPMQNSPDLLTRALQNPTLLEAELGRRRARDGTDRDVLAWIEATFGVHIPAVACCPGHVGRWCTDPAPSVRHDRPPGHRGDSRCMIST